MSLFSFFKLFPTTHWLGLPFCPLISFPQFSSYLATHQASPFRASGSSPRVLPSCSLTPAPFTSPTHLPCHPASLLPSPSIFPSYTYGSFPPSGSKCGPHCLPPLVPLSASFLPVSPCSLPPNIRRLFLVYSCPFRTVGSSVEIEEAGGKKGSAGKKGVG